MLFLININGELRKVAGSICSAIYSLISILFDVFYSLANIRILNAGTMIDGVWHDAPITIIYKRITLLLGIIMVFYVTFQFVKYVLEPDTFADKEKGGEKLVFKLIIVVVLMGTVPTIFDKAYDIQRLILNSHLIDKVLIGHPDTDISSFGKNMSASVFGLFYYLDDATSKDFDCKNGLTCQETINMNISNLATAGSMPMITSGLGVEVNDNKFAIHFDTWFAMGVGLFLCYILVLYVIDIGVRVAQLTYLQIIAPIPIISYLSPKKDGMFQKWVKQCVVTFLDVFIRLFIIYFMLLVISNINISSIGESINASVDETTKTWVYIALILGLLLFAQKAPKLIQELFPNMGAAMGNFGLKPGDRMPALAAKAAAMGLGGASALARKTIGRTANALKHNRREKKAAGIDDYKYYKRLYRNAMKNKDASGNERNEAYNKMVEAKKAYKEKYGGYKKKVKEAKKAYKAAKKSGDLAKIEEARKDLHEERDKYQTAKHKKDSVTGALFSGVITGTATGMIQGSKAKDLKSIGSAVKSAGKAASQQVKAHSDWKEQGGMHATGRIIEGVKSHFGIESGAESQKREQDAVQRSIENSKQQLKEAQRPAEQSSSMQKALEQPKEAVEAQLTKPGKIKRKIGRHAEQEAENAEKNFKAIEQAKKDGKTEVKLPNGQTVAVNDENIRKYKTKAEEARSKADEKTTIGNMEINGMTTSEVMSELEKNVTVAENNLREAQSKTVDDSQIKSAETRKNNAQADYEQIHAAIFDPTHPSKVTLSDGTTVAVNNDTLTEYRNRAKQEETNFNNLELQKKNSEEQIQHAEEEFMKAKEYLSTGKKLVTDAISEELFADIKSGTSMEELNTYYSIEVVKAMQDTINSVTVMSHDSEFMSRFRVAKEELPKELQAVFYDGDNPREELHFETYDQMKKLKDYCQTFSANVTRTNEELKLEIENREFDLAREKANTSRRYEANSKDPIGSGYTGGSSGK